MDSESASKQVECDDLDFSLPVASCFIAPRMTMISFCHRRSRGNPSDIDDDSEFRMTSTRYFAFATSCVWSEMPCEMSAGRLLPHQERKVDKCLGRS
jgi:hypothetical protein